MATSCAAQGTPKNGHEDSIFALGIWGHSTEVFLVPSQANTTSLAPPKAVLVGSIMVKLLFNEVDTHAPFTQVWPL
jgi:hypothetical protein